MRITVGAYKPKEVFRMTAIWNKVVEDGNAFPQEKTLGDPEGIKFFESQTFSASAVDEDTGDVVGLYILHPNNEGRCGHIANASFAVDDTARGGHIGEKLVMHCISQAGKEGFRILQFNAVVATNIHARHLYERCGFHPLGVIPGGFRMKDGHYEDICPYYIDV